MNEVRTQLLELQNNLITALEAADGGTFKRDHWQRLVLNDVFTGDGCSCTLENGAHIERGAVLFSHIIGQNLPPTATASRPHLAGASFEVIGISCVVHPRNPFAPTAHMNVRCFETQTLQGLTRWFGGGMDLTPSYLFHDDAHDFHIAAQKAVGTHYVSWKQACDAYFWIQHRKESRGIGGVFFDDYTDPDGLDTIIQVTQAFMDAYPRILNRRKGMPFAPEQRAWQLQRRGRYAEFNLVWDRGTAFGLQSGGRIESILASMPPLASWSYDAQVAVGSSEAALIDVLRNPRDWI